MSFKARTLAHKKLREQKLRDQKKLAALPSVGFGGTPEGPSRYAAASGGAPLGAGESGGEGDAVALEARAKGAGKPQLDVEAPQ